MLVVKLIGKALVKHVNFLVICLCLGLGKSKILLLFLLLKLSILLLVVVVLKCYRSNNNWVILVLHCIIFLSFMTIQVPSISPRILFSTYAPSILRLGIISLEIMHLKVTYALNMLTLSTNLLIFSPNPWMKISFARLEENLAWLMWMMFELSCLLNLFCMICHYDEWNCISVEHFLAFSGAFMHFWVKWFESLFKRFESIFQ